jgi:hypothetical protein
MDVGSCRFLNLRTHMMAYNCPHCYRYGRLKAHGFLKSASGEIRGVRLYCANRRGLGGCGRTYSIHFADRMRNATLGADKIGTILEAALGGTREGQGTAVRPTISEAVGGICAKSTAYRWIERFRQLQCFTFRPLLYQAILRDDQPYTGTPEQHVWTSMRGTFGGVAHAVGTMQMCFQMALFPSRPKIVRPTCHRSISEVLARFLMATGIGTALTPECGYFGSSTRRRMTESG